jgi:hypothetical protein
MTRTSPVMPGALVTAAMLDMVPAAARRYLDWTGVEGRYIPSTVCLTQVGRLRSTEDKPWMNFVAEQDYITDPPAFSWRARVRVGGLPLVRAWDSYVSGQGRMQVRLARAITLADLAGDAMNEASLLRYLNEMTWFPGAFLLPNIRWHELDERSVRVSIADSGLTATGMLTFGADGRPVEFVALRQRHLGKGRMRVEPWATPYTDYGLMNGVMVPTAGWAEYRTAGEVCRYIEVELVRPPARPQLHRRPRRDGVSP